MAEEKVKKVKCLSVKAQDLRTVGKAYKIRCYNGAEGYVPKSLLYGRDESYTKGEGYAYWIPEWFLRKSNLQYSHKTYKWFVVDETGEPHPIPTKAETPNHDEKLSPGEKKLLSDFLEAVYDDLWDGDDDEAETPQE